VAAGSPPRRVTPKFELLIDGSPADPTALASIILIRARVDLELADAVEVLLSNEDLAWSEGDTFLEGKRLALKLSYVEGDEALVPVAAGDIVRREVSFPLDGPSTVMVVAYDRRHLLKRGRFSNAWENEKDSDIVRELAADAGLDCVADDTGVVLPYVFQQAQSHWSFIRERAALYEYEVAVDPESRTLFFRRPQRKEGAVRKLKWGEDLYSFRVRMSTDEQVSKVVVRGWDPKKKEKIVATAESGAVDALGASAKGPDVAQQTFSQREVLYPARPMIAPAEADPTAQAIMNRHAHRYSNGYASCRGEPELTAGAVVEVEGVGARANGKYYVTSALHFYEPRTGYVTHFELVRPSERTQAEEPPPWPEPLPPREAAPAEPANRVEIVVHSDTGQDLTGMPYKVTLPDGTVQRGAFDSSGKIRIDGVKDAGDAKVEVEPPEGARPVNFSEGAGGE